MLPNCAIKCYKYSLTISFGTVTKTFLLALVLHLVQSQAQARQWQLLLIQVESKLYELSHVSMKLGETAFVVF